MKNNLFTMSFFLGKKFFLKNKIFYISVLFYAISLITTISLPVIIGKMTSVFQHGSSEAGNSFLSFFLGSPLRAVCTFAVCGILSLLFSVIYSISEKIMLNSITCEMKLALHNKLLLMDAFYHQTHKQADCMANVNSASCTVMALQSFFSLPLVMISAVIPGFVMLFASLKQANIPTVVNVILLPLIILQPVIGFWLGNVTNKLYSSLRSANISVTNQLINSFSAPLEIRLMQANKQREQSLRKSLYAHMKKAVKAHVVGVFENQLTSSFVLFIQIVIAFIAALNFSAENKDASAGIIQCLFLIPTIFSHISLIIGMYAQQKQTEPELAAVYDVLKTAESDHNKNIVLDNTEIPDICFKNVDFGYEKDKLVLSDLSLQIPKGKTVAIVSHSGGGKSTLFNLLSGLYCVNSGIVLINGNNINNIPFCSLHSVITRISQFPLFINGTLLENFQLQKEDAGDDEIRAVCLRAGIYDMLGFDKNDNISDFCLDLNADNLSGGQKRLLSIARALLKNPQVVMIDEPTTGVDAQTIRHAILPLLQELKTDRTMLLVDHNMNFVRDLADMVLVLENGKVTDFGPTEDIWQNKDSLFRKLWEEYNKNTEFSNELDN